MKQRVIKTKQPKISPGDLLTPIFHSSNVWNEDGDTRLDTTHPGDILTVISSQKWRHNNLHLNTQLYVKVLSPNGSIGWIHSDNFKKIL